jgi:hypothetical protein
MVASQPGARFAVRDCGELMLTRADFSRRLFKLEGQGMVAVATVDAEATLEGGVQVSYLGLERTPFRFEGARWQLDGPLLPALHEVLSLLCRRQRALAEGDVAALRALGFEPGPTSGGAADPFRVRRWILRVDRDGAEVLEQGETRNSRFALKRENGSFRPIPTVL